MSRGLGLGTQFSALLTHLTAAVPTRYAPDISGVSTTVMEIGAAVCVAAFGTLYLGLGGAGREHADRAFAVTTAALALLALAACAAAHRATRTTAGPQRRSPATSIEDAPSTSP